ncbi:cytochrome P450 [Aspergillus pseudoustus]|uniref:Cytochrome P450 n=1 Tax=Aspergillus pseudoustus TaxID=1810923 RepID=A0ABR4JT01_9EURO
MADRGKRVRFPERRENLVAELICLFLHFSDPIYKLTFAGSTEVMINSVALTNELCDESRFSKMIGPSLEELRSAAGSGLFTAYNEEPAWEAGHRLLAPVFGPTKIRNMFDHMYEVVEQLSLKWERYGSTYPIEVADDFSRVTLDTIALCGMSFRFNSFYRDGTFHPFVDSMNRWLKNSDTMGSTPKILRSFLCRTRREYKYDIRLMRQTCVDLIDRRKKDDSEHEDLLDSLLNGVDPTTGDRLSEESCIDNLITLLIAGHETTAGLLAFVFYYLAKYPHVQRKAHEEVDRAYGDGNITVNDLQKLRYITATLRETLRLNPRALSWGVAPHRDEIIGWKSHVKKVFSIFSVAL